MDRVLPSKVEAVLLFDDYSGFGPRELLALLNEVSADYGHTFKRTQLENSPGYLNYFSDGLVLEITHSDVPLAPDGFNAVLESGFTSMVFPEAQKQVEAHQKYVFVALTHCGTSHNDPEGHMPPQEPKGPMSDEQFTFAINMIKNLVLIYGSRSIPRAVHWIQSNKLLDFKQFATLALETKDISLLIHPSLFSSGEDENGAQLVGLRTYGAACLIGKEIIFEEAPVEPEVLFDRVLQFVTRSMETGWFIPDGDTFGLDEREAIRVHHIDDEYDEQGVVQLIFERSDELGFDFTPQMMEEDEEPSDVDPDDPVEKALQEKLEQLKASDQPSEEEAAVESGEEEVPQKVVEPWQGTGKKPDINALRALTQVPQKEEKSSFWKDYTASTDPASSREPEPGSAPIASLPDVEQSANATDGVEPEADAEKPPKLLKKVSGLFAKK